MEQKRHSALPRDDKPGLRAGNLIYTRVVVPNTQFENRQKIFVVKQVRGDGRFTAYAFTSHQERTKYATSFALKADEVNLLSKDSVVQVSPEYDFPADWKYTKLHERWAPYAAHSVAALWAAIRAAADHPAGYSRAPLRAGAHFYDKEYYPPGK